MGVIVSTEDFATLEGFINQDMNTRSEILKTAGWELEEQDLK
jgi:hypothetical protein